MNRTNDNRLHSEMNLIFIAFQIIINAKFNVLNAAFTAKWEKSFVRIMFILQLETSSTLL